MVDKKARSTEDTMQFINIDGVIHIVDLDKEGSVKEYLNRVMDDPLMKWENKMNDNQKDLSALGITE